MSALSAQLRSFRHELRQYLSYVHSQAYTDTMTGVGSKTAYLKKVRHIDKQIGAGSAAFAVAVFDMNGLKKINDNYGHEMGDRFIIGAASVIKKVFGSSNVYRIGGDEFISIIESCTEKDIADFFARLDTVIEEINSASRFPLRLTISKGAAVFSAETDTSCNQVFKRADEAMYDDKCEFYKRSAEETQDITGSDK
nr:GGDEF domain-containing protein [Ruminococcus sp.]